MSNAFPRSVGGSGWDHDPSADAADRRPPPLFPDDPPPPVGDRDPLPPHDDWARSHDQWAGAPDQHDRQPATPGDHDRQHATSGDHDRQPAAPGDHDPQPAAPRPYDGPSPHERSDDIETPVPAAQRVRGMVASVIAAGRSSVPVRTVLFLVPPLLVPPLAFNLSLGATLGVWLLLLWLVGATAVVTTLMMDGADMVAMRAIGRQLERIADAPEQPPAAGHSGADGRPVTRPADDEPLLIVGEQLDALNDRLDALEARGGTSHAGPIDHRPPEQWSLPRGAVDNDGDDHDVAHGRHWSPPRWQ